MPHIIFKYHPNGTVCHWPFFQEELLPEQILDYLSGYMGMIPIKSNWTSDLMNNRPTTFRDINHADLCFKVTMDFDEENVLIDIW